MAYRARGISIFDIWSSKDRRCRAGVVNESVAAYRARDTSICDICSLKDRRCVFGLKNVRPDRVDYFGHAESEF